MKNLILTMAIGERAASFLALSLPLLRAYADRIGADCDVITQSIYGDPRMAHFNKLQIRDYLKRYSRVLYVDADVIALPDAPSIFEASDPSFFAAWEESSLFAQPRLVRAIQGKFGEISHWKDTVFNLGIFVASRDHAELFQVLDPALKDFRRVKEADVYSDQAYFNWKLQQLRLPSFSLPVFWNWNPICGYIHPRAHFVHFLGSGFFEPLRDRRLPAQDSTAKRLRQMNHLVDSLESGVEPSTPAVDLCVMPPGVRCALSLPHYFYPAGRYQVEFSLHKRKSLAGGPVTCVLLGKKQEENVLAEWKWDARKRAVTHTFSTPDLFYPQFCFGTAEDAERVHSVRIGWVGELSQKPL